ncbi:hypothetical protein T439DRAFT_360526 [Meredithblackwellia eburnea MCA 4105]
MTQTQITKQEDEKDLKVAKVEEQEKQSPPLILDLFKSRKTAITLLGEIAKSDDSTRATLEIKLEVELERVVKGAKELVALVPETNFEDMDEAYDFAGSDSEDGEERERRPFLYYLLGWAKLEEAKLAFSNGSEDATASGESLLDEAKEALGKSWSAHAEFNEEDDGSFITLPMESETVKAGALCLDRSAANGDAVTSKTLKISSTPTTLRPKRRLGSSAVNDADLVQNEFRRERGDPVQPFLEATDALLAAIDHIRDPEEAQEALEKISKSVKIAVDNLTQQGKSCEGFDTEDAATLSSKGNLWHNPVKWYGKLNIIKWKIGSLKIASETQ